MMILLCLFSHALIDAVKLGNIDESTFWQEIEEKGTPLIEEDEVTFLWKGDASTKNVVLFGTLWMNPKNAMLNHIPSTSIWYKTEKLAPDIRGVYFLSPNDPLENPMIGGRDHFFALFSTWQDDPFNKKKYYLPSMDKVFSEFEMKGASPEPWVVQNSNLSKTELISFQIKSAILQNERIIEVYLPSGYRKSASPYPVIFFFDGQAYTEVIPTPTILDNLIAAGKIPPIVAVFIKNATKTSRSKELPCNPDFAKFLKEELLPSIHSRVHITDDPQKTILAGSSFGGLAACYAALCYPECFGKVLSQSGSFWWGHEELIHAYEKAPNLPIRFYLSVGKFETGMWDFDLPSMVDTNRKMEALLKKKGCAVDYIEFPGGHEYSSWRATLPQALEILANH